MTPYIAKELHEKMEIVGIEVHPYSICITQQFFLIFDEDLDHNSAEKLKSPLLAMEVIELVIALIAHTI